MSKERIRLGGLYAHPETGEPGMIVWVGKHRDAITGDYELACTILWQGGEENTYFNYMIHDGIRFVGTFKKISQATRKMGVDKRYTVNGTRDREAPILHVWVDKNAEHETPTQRVVKAWKARYSPQEATA